jgi:hypothetical protein
VGQKGAGTIPAKLEINQQIEHCRGPQDNPEQSPEKATISRIAAWSRESATRLLF